MLVLSRQRYETLMIGDDISVEVVDIRGDKVRLGITAPKEMPVHRKEVYDSIQRELRKKEKFTEAVLRTPIKVDGRDAEPAPAYESLPYAESDDWIPTPSGRPFWLMNPQPQDVNIHDIADTLAKVCRFGGRSQRFLSVAQHSVIVSQAVGADRDLQLRALMHDAAEAYVCDVPSPIKRLIPQWDAIECRVHCCIAAAFGYSPDIPPEINLADKRALATERRDNQAPQQFKWRETEGIEPFPFKISPWTIERAKVEFLSRFATLYGKSV